MPVQCLGREINGQTSITDTCVCTPLYWVCCGAAQHPTLAQAPTLVNHSKTDSSHSPSIRQDTQPSLTLTPAATHEKATSRR
jgi:hypothetical protein